MLMLMLVYICLIYVDVGFTFWCPTFTTLRLPWITPPDVCSIWPWNITHLLEWLSHSFPLIVICSIAMLYYHSRICHDLSFSCSKKSCIVLGFSAIYHYISIVYLVGGFKHLFIFHIYIIYGMSSQPHWRAPSFFYMVQPPSSDVFCYGFYLWHPALGCLFDGTLRISVDPSRNCEHSETPR